jgi:hypothetical protein
MSYIQNERNHMVEVIFSGMLSKSIACVLYRGQYYRVRAADITHKIALTYTINSSKLTDRIEKE